MRIITNLTWEGILLTTGRVNVLLSIIQGHLLHGSGKQGHTIGTSHISEETRLRFFNTLMMRCSNSFDFSGRCRIVRMLFASIHPVNGNSLYYRSGYAHKQTWTSTQIVFHLDKFILKWKMRWHLAGEIGPKQSLATDSDPKQSSTTPLGIILCPLCQGHVPACQVYHTACSTIQTSIYLPRDPDAFLFLLLRLPWREEGRPRRPLL